MGQAPTVRQHPERLHLPCASSSASPHVEIVSTNVSPAVVKRVFTTAPSAEPHQFQTWRACSTHFASLTMFLCCQLHLLFPLLGCLGHDAMFDQHWLAVVVTVFQSAEAETRLAAEAAMVMQKVFMKIV